jgi:DNA-binding response OmpR family regulator
MTITRTISASSHDERQQIQVRDIQWNTEQHSIKIGRTVITLTPTEYRLLLPLRSGTPVTYADLAWTAYQYKVDDKVREAMDKHIDRIRCKLRGSGIYVYCVLGYGYLLLPEHFPDENELLPSAQYASSL